MSRRFPIAITCQVATVACAIVGATLWPPEHGAMLLIPLSGRIADPVDVALSGGAALLATGPLPGSLVVLGDRRTVAIPAIDRGILVLSAPRSLCGAAGVPGTVA